MNHPLPNTDSSLCNLCGSLSAQYLYRRHRLLRCGECGLVRDEIMPDRERLKQLYSEAYFRSTDSGALGYDDYAADRVKITQTFRKRMQELEKWTGHKGRLLDVGCATGFSLEVARELGWETQGIEISEYACKLARDNLGDNIFCGLLEEANLKPESFDVITMWDYIEHCPDPTKDLSYANRLLKTGGLLALTTPNITSLPARIWGPRWMGIKPGEHLYYFSPPTIKRLLVQLHFEPVLLRHVGKYIDVDFFIKRTGLYSSIVQRMLARMVRLAGIADRVLYVNPFDIMLVYGKKLRDVE